MNSTILQIPIDKNIRNQAALRVEKMGFSSLQEVVRVFLAKMAAGEIDVAFEQNVQLSAKAVKRYNKIIDGIESGKVKTRSFTDVNLLMKHLNED